MCVRRGSTIPACGWEKVKALGRKARGKGAGKLHLGPVGGKPRVSGRLAARPETLGGRRGEDLAGADKLHVSEAFAFALGAESIDLEMLRNSGTSDRARRPPATGGAIRPETPRRGRAGRQVRLGGYGRHDWAFSRSGAPMRPPPAYALPAARVVPRGSNY